MRLSDEHLELLMQAACRAHGVYVESGNLVLAGSLVGGRLCRARDDSEGPLLFATDEGMKVLLARKLVEPDEEMGGYMRTKPVRTPA